MAEARPVSAINAYYGEGLEARIARILAFFSLASRPDILTVTRGSDVDLAAMRRAFPDCRFAEVENEFEGYQRACEIAARDFPGRALLVTNDSLGRHWKLSALRRLWFGLAVRRAAAQARFAVLSEHHRGKPGHFPVTAGITQWATSNYILTNDPAGVGALIAQARGRAMPESFFEAARGAVENLFRTRHQPVSEERLRNKIGRIHIEFAFFELLLQSAIAFVPAIHAQNPLHRLHRLIDR